MNDSEFGTKTRRELLALLGGVGAAVVIAGCGGDGSGSGAARSSNSPGSTTSTTASTSTTSSSSAAVTSCSKIPEETAGPYPGDGSNGPNVLTQDGVVRSDIRSSFGSASAVADGVPLTVNLTILDASTCKPRADAAVYIWHCDMLGRYSMYSQGVTGENFLRGVQGADSNALVSFQSIFPGAYSGHWPHIHFAVFPGVAEATGAANKLATSQIALPKDVCDAVYATSGYGQSVQNFAQDSLSTDMVFRDGVSLQTPTMTGSTRDGYEVALNVAV